MLAMFVMFARPLSHFIVHGSPPWMTRAIGIATVVKLYAGLTRRSAAHAEILLKRCLGKDLFPVDAKRYPSRNNLYKCVQLVTSDSNMSTRFPGPRFKNQNSRGLVDSMLITAMRQLSPQ
jgi:hypothetical protein